jgi:hypothetical protein
MTPAPAPPRLSDMSTAGACRLTERNRDSIANAPVDGSERLPRMARASLT